MRKILALAALAAALGPGGGEAFGANQCLNDKDKSVDHDERLTILGAGSGAYDAKIGFPDGKVCKVKGVVIEAGKCFRSRTRISSTARSEAAPGEDRAYRDRHRGMSRSQTKSSWPATGMTLTSATSNFAPTAYFAPV